MNRFEWRRTGLANEVAGTRPSLHGCVQAVVQLSDTLMQEVLDGLAILTHGIRVNNAFACPFPIDKGMTELLCRNAPAVTQTFVTQLEIIVCSGPQLVADRPAASFLDLQQLNIERIDANIEFALALHEVSRCVDGVLPTVDALISSLSGWIRVQPLLNPVKTEVFAQALLACLTLHVPDRSVRRALLLPAAGLLGVSLCQHYRELCEWLQSQGIESCWPVDPRLGSDRAVPVTAMNNSVNRTIGILEKFRRLLSGDAEDSARGSAEQDFLPTVPLSFTALEDLNLIAPLMQRLATREIQFAQATAKQHARGGDICDESARVRLLNRDLGEEVLPLMLDRLLQDRRLLPSVRDQIRRLEPALLCLARSDPRFFSDCQHPARQLLAWFIRHGLLCDSVDEQDIQWFFTAVTAAIDALHSTDCGASSFASVLRKLEDQGTFEAMLHCSADGLEQRQPNQIIPDFNISMATWGAAMRR
ncbi:MAG: DUF1631 family protein [Rhodoferax sp.]